MIILFVLAGVLLLGGGAATIIDGLPYLVLERGFTQVIVGTVAATGGLLMLALAWVLVELRRVRTTVSNAMVAVSIASMAGGASASASAPAAAGLVAGAGLAAGVGAALIATKAFADDKDGEAVETPAIDRSDEPDLFAQALGAVADRPQAEASQAEARDEAHASQDIPDHADDAEPAELTADRERSDTKEAEHESPHGAWLPDAVGIDHEAEAPAAIEAPADEPAEHRGRVEPWLDWPEPEVAGEHDALKSEAKSDDEFGFLRESLAGHSAQAEEAQHRARDDEAPRKDTLRQAESWMDSSGTRRAPWFEKPEAAQPDRDETQGESSALQPPPWPPQTRDPVEVAPSIREPWFETDAREPEPMVEPIEPVPMQAIDADQPSPAAGTDANLHAPEPVEETEPGPAAEPEPPAASEEGIIGAYQVGDAHFTIFADGSIKARTPDGDYSFASMDELKTYLASEKSRLGV